MTIREAPLRLLFVCTANVCRSPYAQLRAQQVLGDAPLVVASAGLRGYDGEPMEAEMAAQLRMRGGDPVGFSSRPFSGRSLTDADLVLTFEAEQRRVIAETWPHAADKVFSWAQFLRGLDRVQPAQASPTLITEVRRVVEPARRADDVADPFGRGTPAAAVCAVQVDRLLQRTLSALVGRTIPV